MHRPRRPPIAVLVLVLVLAVVAAYAVVAADPEPQRPRDRMDKAIETLAAHAQNARVKLKADVGGFGRGGAATAGRQDEDLSRGGRIGRGDRPEAAPKAGKPSECCGRNIETMNRELAVVEAVLVEYANRVGDDEQAREKITAMAGHWKSVGESLRLFSVTDSREAARSSLGAAIGSVADLERAHAEFLDCCAPRSGWNQQ